MSFRVKKITANDAQLTGLATYSGELTGLASYGGELTSLARASCSVLLVDPITVSAV